MVNLAGLRDAFCNEGRVAGPGDTRILGRALHGCSVGEVVGNFVGHASRPVMHVHRYEALILVDKWNVAAGFKKNPGRIIRLPVATPSDPLTVTAAIRSIYGSFIEEK